MYFMSRARGQLLSLHDSGPPGLVDKIEGVLDELERDHGQSWLRARRFQNPPAFAVPARYRSDDYLILWRLDDKEPAVIYVGPAF